MREVGFASDRIPKPLIPVVNKPLITYAFDHLLGIGVDTVDVMRHFCGDIGDFS